MCRSMVDTEAELDTRNNCSGALVILSLLRSTCGLCIADVMSETVPTGVGRASGCQCATSPSRDSGIHSARSVVEGSTMQQTIMACRRNSGSHLGSASSTDSDSHLTPSIISQHLHAEGSSVPKAVSTTTASCREDASIPGSPTLVHENARHESCNGSPIPCSKQRPKYERERQQSPKEKVDAWLKFCVSLSDHRDESIEIHEVTSALDGEVKENEDEPLPSSHLGHTVLEDDITGDEKKEDVSRVDTDTLSIQQLLFHGCKLLDIDSNIEERTSDEPAVLPRSDPDISFDSPTSNSPDPEELEADTSSSETSSFGISPDQIKRSASLKTSKTPPGTPGRKKFVRFADAMGLELHQVRMFRDGIPTVPRSAFLGLNPDRARAWMYSFSTPCRQASHHLQPLFLPPASLPGFMERLHRGQVLLESVQCRDEDSSIRCVVRVMNLGFQKFVRLRYTLDDWLSWSERTASYMPGSSDGQSDRFQATIYGSTMTFGQVLQLAVAFYCNGVEHWDSNGGLNYIVQCTQSLEPRLQPGPDEWSGGQF